MTSSGIIYVASRHDLFIEEAFLSAESIRRKGYAYPITLFTDRSDHKLFHLGVFDEVRSFSGNSHSRISWSAGLIDKLTCLQRTPYDKTLFLDTDTLVLTRRLESLFTLAESIDIGMVEAATEDSFSRHHYQKAMFNTGVILYRRTHQIWSLFERWIDASERNANSATELPLPYVPLLAHVPDKMIRRKLLTNDQIGLVEFLSPEINTFNLKVQSLSYAWNHRGSKLSEKNNEPIYIRHWPRSSIENHKRNLYKAICRIAKQHRQ